MGKRKSGVPQRAEASKRQNLSWNMSDLQHRVHITNDNDPELIAERHAANELVARIQKEADLVEIDSGADSGYSERFETTSFETDEKLKEMINNSVFYISIYDKLPNKLEGTPCKIGQFYLQILKNGAVLPRNLPTVAECWMYVMTEPYQNYLLYFEVEQDTSTGVNNNVIYFEAMSDMPHACFRALEMKCYQLKTFCLVVNGYDSESGKITIDLYALEGSMKKLSFPNEGSQPKQSHLAMIHLMSHFHGFTVPDLTQFPFTKKHNIEALYKEIKERHAQKPQEARVSVQHPCLKPRLRDYQKQAVVWMLSKERYKSHMSSIIEDQEDKNLSKDVLHLLYDEFQSCDGQQFYYNRHAGYMVREKPLASVAPPGGILADEMGLGKTVEVLACILIHARTDLPKPEPLPVIETTASPSHHTRTDLPKPLPVIETTPSPSHHTQDEETKHTISSDGDKPGSPGGAQIDPDTPASHSLSSEQSCQSSEEGLKPDWTASQGDHIYAKRAHDAGCDGGNLVLHSEHQGTSQCICGVEQQFGNNQLDIMSCPLCSGANIPPGDILADQLTCKPKAKRKSRSKSQSGDQPPTAKSGTSKGKSKSKALKKHKKRDGVSSMTKVQGQLQNQSKLENLEKSEKNHFNSRASVDCRDSVSSAADGRVLECICGEQAFVGIDSRVVDCGICGLYQHPQCVNYDLCDPYRGVYLCPHCHIIAPPVPSGATLIISPSSISHQWQEEIEKHIHEKSLNVLVYTGVSKQGFIQPQTLAKQDIVILSYETLRKEIDYVDLPHSNSESGRRFRNPKRFMAIPSPIVAVEWWRICLDEAQMVETVTTKTAEMALRLKAVNKWCVTGTPIQRSIEDIYGLLLFLGVEPYWVRHWWNDLLYKPYCHGQRERLYNVLTKTLWRTAKQDVLDQICLPPQSEEIHWLTFSPVEEHFYRRQYQDCAREAMQRLSKWTDNQTKLSSLDRATLQQLLHPLVRLRQACCHPQAVRGAFLPIHKSTLTMEELLNQLIKKARLECEESHRQLVFALNGLAALDIIQNDIKSAVESYRSVMRSAEEHKAEIRTDELQQLHTLHNLHEILLTKPPGVPPTLRDSQLYQQAAEIKKRYIARFEQQVTQAQDVWAPIKKSLREVTSQLRQRRNWWMELLEWVSHDGDLGILLVERVKEELADNRKPGVQSLVTRFRNVQGLEYILAVHLEELQTRHEAVVRLLYELSEEPTEDLVNQTVDCCLRPADQILKTCPFCDADAHFQKYESKLFSFVDKGLTEQHVPDTEDSMYLLATRRQGTWADSECELALKAIISFARTWRGNSKVIDYGGIHMKVFDALKKEFKCLRTLWLYLRERVSAVDELDMATTRMRLRMIDEPRSDVPQPNILEPSELGTQRLKLKSDHVIYSNELKKKLGQLLYLKNLVTAQTELEDGQNPAQCPVCQRKLGSKWSVLQCGHCYCLGCVRVLVEKYSCANKNPSLKCPVCRQRTRHADISYVSTKGSDCDKETDGIKVKGDHSTKIEGIVRCLLTIYKTQPRAKTLVFSTWADVLDVLTTALNQNDITYRSLHVHHKFQKNLDSFKHDDGVQVLLLPVHSGSNGLNLIEATHVVLVEPILNVAQELQAIGRVHRIGQTQATVVHRFLVRGTIEERMSHLLQTVQTPTNSHHAEETTLTIGEFSSLFDDISPDLDEEDGDEDIGETVEMVDNDAEQEMVARENIALEDNDNSGEPLVLVNNVNDEETMTISDNGTEQEVVAGDNEQEIVAVETTTMVDNFNSGEPLPCGNFVNSFGTVTMVENVKREENITIFDNGTKQEQHVVAVETTAMVDNVTCGETTEMKNFNAGAPLPFVNFVNGLVPMAMLDNVNSGEALPFVNFVNNGETMEMVDNGTKQEMVARNTEQEVFTRNIEH